MFSRSAVTAEIFFYNFDLLESDGGVLFFFLVFCTVWSFMKSMNSCFYAAADFYFGIGDATFGDRLKSSLDNLPTFIMVLELFILMVMFT